MCPRGQNCPSGPGPNGQLQISLFSDRMRMMLEGTIV